MTTENLSTVAQAIEDAILEPGVAVMQETGTPGERIIDGVIKIKEVLK